MSVAPPLAYQPPITPLTHTLISTEMFLGGWALYCTKDLSFALVAQHLQNSFLLNQIMFINHSQYKSALQQVMNGQLSVGSSSTQHSLLVFHPKHLVVGVWVSAIFVFTRPVIYFLSYLLKRNKAVYGSIVLPFLRDLFFWKIIQ